MYLLNIYASFIFEMYTLCLQSSGFVSRQDNLSEQNSNNKLLLFTPTLFSLW